MIQLNGNLFNTITQIEVKAAKFFGDGLLVGTIKPQSEPTHAFEVFVLYLKKH